MWLCGRPLARNRPRCLCFFQPTHGGNHLVDADGHVNVVERPEADRLNRALYVLVRPQ